MKGILITIVIIAAIGAGLWKLSADRRAEVLAHNEAVRQAREAAVRNERLELYGEAGLAPEITWTETGLGYVIRAEGKGLKPKPGEEVVFNYTVHLKDGTLVQETEEPMKARIGQMIPGISAGLQLIAPKGEVLLFVPPKLGYGRQAYGPIPAGAGLRFEVELLPH